MTGTGRIVTGVSRLFTPSSVAVIGASDDRTRIGGRPIHYMLSQGFAGAILPVNPKRADVQGLRAYGSVTDLPSVPDVAIVAVAADLVAPAVRALTEAGVAGAIVLSAGFAETGPVGAMKQAELVAIARGGGMRLLGPNCLGLFNARIGFYPIFSSSFENGWPLPGRIGIASQSGAFGTHMFAVARDRGLGTPLCVTTGNEADIALGEVIHALVDDPDIDVIMAYAEGIRDGDSFIAALAAAQAARKPVVLLKVGRSVLGTTAAQSHTAAIAGNDAVTEAVLAEFGVARARTTEELIDIASLATRRIYPAANTLGVLTISGGAGVLVSDEAEALGLAMPPMPADAQDRLRALIGFCAPGNPVDCTAQAFNDQAAVETFAEEMVAAGGYASVLYFFTTVGAAPSIAPRLRAQLRAVRDRHPDRLHVVSVVAPDALVREYEADGFPVYADPSRAVRAIAAMGRFGAAFAAPSTADPPVIPRIVLPVGRLDEAKCKTLLASVGVVTVPETACATAEQAVTEAHRIGFPVVMKILSPDIVHKSDIGGVLLGVSDHDAVRAGFARLIGRAGKARPDARITGVLVARQMSGGVECIMGVHRDPVFGPIALFGLGGVFVEILNYTVLRRCPFGADEAEAMIRSVRGAAMLSGARGWPPVDIQAAARMLARLSVFAAQAGARLKAIDLNPVFVLASGAVAVDAVIELEELDAH